MHKVELSLLLEQHCRIVQFTFLTQIIPQNNQGLPDSNNSCSIYSRVVFMLYLQRHNSNISAVFNHVNMQLFNTLIECKIVIVYIITIQACYLWLLSYPTNLLVAMVLPYYWRPAVRDSYNFTHCKCFVFQLMTVGVSVIQMVAMAMLGRLFLSRSLYWEVSSLSATTLPLHGDQSFASMKFRNYRSFQ